MFGGGTLTVNGGTYTSHGTGSPVIYSTADITVNNANLTSTASEGVAVITNKNNDTSNTENTTQKNSSIKTNIIVPIAIVLVIICAVFIVKKVSKKDNK